VNSEALTLFAFSSHGVSVTWNNHYQILLWASSMSMRFTTLWKAVHCFVSNRYSGIKI